MTTGVEILVWAWNLRSTRIAFTWTICNGVPSQLVYWIPSLLPTWVPSHASKWQGSSTSRFIRKWQKCDKILDLLWRKKRKKKKKKRMYYMMSGWKNLNDTRFKYSRHVNSHLSLYESWGHHHLILSLMSPLFPSIDERRTFSCTHQ